MKTRLIILALFMQSVFLKAQNPGFQWADGFGSTSPDYVYSMVTDKQGNTYSTGMFQGKTDFDPDPAKTHYLGPSNKLWDMFILKLSPEGKLVWVMSIGLKCYSSGKSIALDPEGNILASGMFSGRADFDPDPAKTFEINAQGDEFTYLMKLGPDGKFKWALNLGPSINMEAVCPDKNGNVYCAGNFRDSISFLIGGNMKKFVSYGGSDILLMKFDTAGTIKWVKQAGGVGYDNASAVASDSASNLVYTGEIQYQADLDPGQGKYIVQGGNTKAYLLKLDPNGDLLWAESFSEGISRGYSDKSVAFDRNGNIVMCGFFLDSSDFDPDSIANHTLPSQGQHDGFILKLDQAGKFIMVVAIGGSDSDITIAEIHGLALDTMQNIYCSGRYNQSVDFDPGAGEFKRISMGYMNPFILKLDKAGNFAWAKEIRGFGQAYSIAVSARGEVFASGDYGLSPDFNSDTAEDYFLQGFGSNDIFIFKYGYCYNSSSVQNISACGALVFNGVTYSSSGQYTQVIPNYKGCDSSIALNLTIISTDTGISLRSKTLYAHMKGNGISYRWIDCKNGNAIIPGAQDSSFTPSKNGSYAVIVVNNDCLDTSACMEVQGIGINMIDLQDTYLVYPNPLSSGILFIVAPVPGSLFAIYSLEGKLISEGKLGAGTNAVNTDLDPGMYYLELRNGPEVKRMQIIVAE